MDLQCGQLASDAKSLLVKAGKSSLWGLLSAFLCSGEPNYEQLCALVVSSLPAPAQSPLDAFCVRAGETCGPAVCSLPSGSPSVSPSVPSPVSPSVPSSPSPSGSPSDLKLTCEEIRVVVTAALQLPQLQADLVKIGFDPSNLCGSLGDVAQGDPTRLIRVIDAALKQQLGATIWAHYSSQLPSVLRCLCPQVMNPSKRPPPQAPSRALLVLPCALLAGALALVALVVGLLLPWKLPAVVVGLLLAGGLWALVVFVWNPKCVFRLCTLDSDDIPPDMNIAGTYSGSKTLFGVTVSASVSIDRDQVSTLHALSCEGGSLCPMKDLLQMCSKVSRKVRLLRPKETNGYALYGPCITAMLNNIKAADGQPILEGAWLVRKNKSLYMQFQLHVCPFGGDSCISYLAVVQLMPVSPSASLSPKL